MPVRCIALNESLGLSVLPVGAASAQDSGSDLLLRLCNAGAATQSVSCVPTRLRHRTRLDHRQTRPARFENGKGQTIVACDRQYGDTTIAPASQEKRP